MPPPQTDPPPEYEQKPRSRRRRGSNFVAELLELAGEHQDGTVEDEEFTKAKKNLIDKYGMVNAAGAEVKLGTKSVGLGRYYCGRTLGEDAIPGSSDGRCGPDTGPQCQDCKSYQKEQAKLQERIEAARKKEAAMRYVAAEKAEKEAAASAGSDQKDGETVGDKWKRKLAAGARTADGAKQVYEEWAEEYDETLKQWNYEAPRRSAGMIAAAGIDTSSTIFDCGCGTGMTGTELAKLGYTNVRGMDLSQKSITIARSKGVYVDVTQGNVNEPLAYPDQHFHGVTCVGVMSYVENYRNLFDEWIRITKPGGIIVFTQRTDHCVLGYRGFLENLQALEEEGQWRLVTQVKDQPYLPDNTNYKMEKTIDYFKLEVTEMT